MCWALSLIGIGGYVDSLLCLQNQKHVTILYLTTIYTFQHRVGGGRCGAGLIIIKEKQVAEPKRRRRRVLGWALCIYEYGRIVPVGVSRHRMESKSVCEYSFSLTRTSGSVSKRSNMTALSIKHNVDSGKAEKKGWQRGHPSTPVNSPTTEGKRRWAMYF